MLCRHFFGVDLEGGSVNLSDEPFGSGVPRVPQESRGFGCSKVLLEHPDRFPHRRLLLLNFVQACRGTRNVVIESEEAPFIAFVNFANGL